jgi:hypothetical protein
MRILAYLRLTKNNSDNRITMVCYVKFIQLFIDILLEAGKLLCIDEVTCVFRKIIIDSMVVYLSILYLVSA